MINASVYLEKGYSNQQVNQILLAHEEGIEDIDYLSPILPDDTFRLYRKLIKKNDLKKTNNRKLVKEINNNINIKLLYDYVNDKDIDTGVFVLKKGEDFFLEMYSKDMSEAKRRSVIHMPDFKLQNELLKYKKYPNSEFSQIAYQIKSHGEIPFDIISNIYNETQLNFIFFKFNESELDKDILNSKYSTDQMELVEYFNKNNLDKKYIENYSAEQTFFFVKFINDEYDISTIYKNHYNKGQLEVIENCFRNKLEPDFLLQKYDELSEKNEDDFRIFSALYLNRVRKEDYDVLFSISNKLYEEGNLMYVLNVARSLHDVTSKEYVDLSPQLKLGYDYYQREIIKQGMQLGLDITKYCTPDFSARVMAFLLDELKNGNVIDNACNIDYTIEQMRAIIFYNTKGIYFNDVSDYEKNYLADRNKDYEIFIKHYNKYAKEDRAIAQTKMFLIDLMVKFNEKNEYQVNIESMLNNNELIMSHESFICDLENGLDVNLLYCGKYNSKQREELRKGMLNNLDILEYSDPSFPDEKMRKIREKLSNRKESLDDKINKYKKDTFSNTDLDDKER